MARLVLYFKGRDRNRTYAVSDYACFGRSSAEDVVQLEFYLDRKQAGQISRVSRRHFAIIRQEDQYFIADMGSTHGTVLNERAVPIISALRETSIEEWLEQNSPESAGFMVLAPGDTIKLSLDNSTAEIRVRFEDDSSDTRKTTIHKPTHPADKEGLLQLFGAKEIEWPGRDASPPLRRLAFNLLGYMYEEKAKKYKAEGLMDVIWQAQDPESDEWQETDPRRQRLSRLMTEIRTALGPLGETVVPERGTNVEQAFYGHAYFSSDSEAFKRYLKHGDPGSLIEALTLYDEFMSGAEDVKYRSGKEPGSFPGWLRGRRDAYSVAANGALEKLAAIQSDKVVRAEQIENFARKLCRIHRAQEPPWYILIHLLACSGRWKEAQSEYDHYLQVLALDDLELEPADRMIALGELITAKQRPADCR